MTYCTKCGAKNDEDAAFCKRCGAAMAKDVGAPPPAGPAGTPYPRRPPPHPQQPTWTSRTDRDWDKECEDECSSGGRYSWVWGVIIVVVGLGIVLEFGIKNIEGLPDWVQDISVWWIIPVLLGVVLIFAGINAISRSGRQGP